MARTRYLKPSFFTNEDLIECSFAARLLFAGLWTIADKAGIVEYRPMRIKYTLFPGDDIDVESLVNELICKQFVVRYEANCPNPTQFLFMPGFEKHQRPHHTEADSTYPKPTAEQLCSNTRYVTVKGALSNGDNLPFNGNEVPLDGNEELERAQSDDCGDRLPEPARFQDLVSGWNSLPTGIAPRCQKPDAPTLLTKWRSIQRSPEARPCFDDVPKVLGMIRGSPFLHGQGWFRLHWLFSKGKTGEWNIAKLMEGAYRNDSNRPRQNQARPSDQQCTYKPDAPTVDRL